MDSKTPATPTARGHIGGEAAYRILKLAGLYAGVAALAAVALQLGRVERQVGYLVQDDTAAAIVAELDAVAEAVKAQGRSGAPTPAQISERSMIEGLFRSEPGDPVAAAIREQTRQQQEAEAAAARRRITAP